MLSLRVKSLTFAYWGSLSLVLLVYVEPRGPMHAMMTPGDSEKWETCHLHRQERGLGETAGEIARVFFISLKEGWGSLSPPVCMLHRRMDRHDMDCLMLHGVIVHYFTVKDLKLKSGILMTN